MPDPSVVKVKTVATASSSAWRIYRQLQYGPLPALRVVWAEVATMLFSGLGGAAGYVLRRLSWRPLLGACGRGVVFGRLVVLRHPSKIRLGEGVIVDDLAVLDAKGDGNEGIRIGNRAYIGRHSIVYCKNGRIEVGDAVNIASNCQLFSSHDLRIGSGTLIGAYSYLMSGGVYEVDVPVPFAEQEGMITRGPLIIGQNCWLGARVTVLDGASIGDHSVVGAGAVITRPLPEACVAAGVPARVLRRRTVVPPAKGDGPDRHVSPSAVTEVKR
jgi:acetyltransferase-like isoleucine patch superfamily enzyme